MRAATAQGLVSYQLACSEQLGVFRWAFVLFYYYFVFLFLGLLFFFLGFLLLLTKLCSSQPTSLTGAVLVLSSSPWGRVSEWVSDWMVPGASGLNQNTEQARCPQLN